MILTHTWTPTMGGQKEHRLPWLKTNNFEKQIQEELPVLYRVARRMGCSSEEAEDTVQNTLVKAYKAWDKFDGRHLRSWLIRILRNERLMALRSQKTDTTSLDEQETTLEIPEQPFWDELSWKLQAEKLMEELESLPEIYRLTIHLCDVEEMTYEEAAESMDIPVGTVRSRLFRARAMLRDRLTPYVENPTGGNR